MIRSVLFAAFAVVIASPALAVPDAISPDEAAFRTTYRTLVETDTTLAHGDCTLAAARMADTLRAAGFSDDRLIAYAAPDHPREGGLVAILPGHSTTLKPLLLVAHIDVVEARREDWPRDPFTLTETNGYFHARGAFDDKAHAAIFVDALANLSRTHAKPKRTIKLALTCGEETTAAFNGADWLAKNRRELVDAAFALNEGGGGRTDGHGKILVQTIQVGEKKYQDYRLETTNPGGHSSIPIKDNAIYELAADLLKVRDLEFPLRMNDTTRAFFAKTGAARGDDLGRAMVALAKDPTDKSAEAVVNADRSYHSMLRTTCVATRLDGGHANNALPQRAGANNNCRIFPGEGVEATRKALIAAIDDPHATLTLSGPTDADAVPPPLNPKVLGPAETLTAKYFPGVPLVPSMSTGATDGIHLEAVGIPVYGVPGFWSDPDGNGVHGLNERKSERAVFVGRDFLTELVKAYAEQE